MQFDGRKKLIVENFERWARRFNFIEQVQTMARLLCMDGTYLAAMEVDIDDLHLIPLFMPNTTIHPKGYDAENDKDVLLAPPVKHAVINEGEKREDKIKEKVILIGELV
ncbi:MAG: hypothetical protein QCH31_11230 [Methanolobus sp.]|nr:hypothetical protein [Methanolobus sp.]